MGFTQTGNNGKKPSGAKKKPEPRYGKKVSAASAKLFLFAALVFLGALLAVICYTLSPGSENSVLPTDVSSSQGGAAHSSAASSEEGAAHSSAASSEESSAHHTTDFGSEASATTAVNSEKPVSSTKNQTKQSPEIVVISEDNWELTLVNTKRKLPDGYVPPKLLNIVNECKLDSRVTPHYLDMYNAALAEGVKLTPFSGYRSYETQKRNYNNKINYYQSMGYGKNEAAVKAATIIMPPGSSEHNLGFAMDIVTCASWFETTKEFTWLRENAYKYGFIMRYAKEKTDITGVIYEPWHWRYVGVKAATEIYQTRNADGVEICLEEYLNAA